jgi:hypothetical protein
LESVSLTEGETLFEVTPPVTADAEAALSGTERLVKRVSLESEVASCLGAAPFALSVIAGGGEAGTAFEAAERALKRVPVRSESVLSAVEELLCETASFALALVWEALRTAVAA